MAPGTNGGFRERAEWASAHSAGSKVRQGLPVRKDVLGRYQNGLCPFWWAQPKRAPGQPHVQVQPIPLHPAEPAIAGSAPSWERLIAPGIRFPYGRDVQGDLVFSVQSEDGIECVLLIGHGGARAGANRLAGQVEILTDVPHAHQEILQ